MTYPPLGIPKRVAAEIWVVDGPVIRFGPGRLAVPFSTRTTIVRLPAGLFVHSPTPLTDGLRDALAALGEVRWIVAPNRLHQSWIAAWRAAYPAAEAWLAPGIAADPASRPLGGMHGYPWDDAIATLPVTGGFMTEVEFFHRPSRTLILTDLIENLEAARLPWWLRLLARLGGVLAPHGSTPRDLRWTFRRHRIVLRAAAETMIGWRPALVVVAHGRCLDRDAPAQLRRALAWCLRGS